MSRAVTPSWRDCSIVGHAAGATVLGPAAGATGSLYFLAGPLEKGMGLIKLLVVCQLGARRGKAF
jgi:hypothetical protein